MDMTVYAELLLMLNRGKRYLKLSQAEELFDTRGECRRGLVRLEKEGVLSMVGAGTYVICCDLAYLRALVARKGENGEEELLSESEKPAVPALTDFKEGTEWSFRLLEDEERESDDDDDDDDDDDKRNDSGTSDFFPFGGLRFPGRDLRPGMDVHTRDDEDDDGKNDEEDTEGDSDFDRLFRELFEDGEENENTDEENELTDEDPEAREEASGEDADLRDPVEEDVPSTLSEDLRRAMDIRAFRRRVAAMPEYDEISENFRPLSRDVFPDGSPVVLKCMLDEDGEWVFHDLGGVFRNLMRATDPSTGRRLGLIRCRALLEEFVQKRGYKSIGYAVLAPCKKCSELSVETAATAFAEICNHFLRHLFD